MSFNHFYIHLSRVLCLGFYCMVGFMLRSLIICTSVLCLLIDMDQLDFFYMLISRYVSIILSMLSSICSRRGHWQRSAPMEVSLWGLVPQRSLAQTCSLSGHSLIPATVEVTGSGLLQWRLLAHDCSHGIHSPIPF